jgi:alanine dehydrogenase
MVVKVKEPQPNEWVQLREGQILFTYLHLAPDPKQAKGLIKSGCTAIAYETVTDARGTLPLLAPMSEVAGRLAIEAAGEAMRRSEGGAGILLGGVPGVPGRPRLRDRWRGCRHPRRPHGGGPWRRRNRG